MTPSVPLANIEENNAPDLPERLLLLPNSTPRPPPEPKPCRHTKIKHQPS